MDLERGYIKHLELEDFKSYEGTHLIGPFSNFTCIIGPNGSGKSNLMDCISFALGLKATDLRAYRLQSMIYNYPQKFRNNEMGAKATVKLVFVTSKGKEVVFSRSVNMNGNSSYKINKKRKTMKEYIEKLSTYGILVEARNFLIFQGDVEGIASKSPKDLANLIEKVSGSIKYQKEYDEKKLKMEQTSDDVITTVEKYKHVYQDHNRLKKHSREAKKFRKIEELYDRKVLEHVLWRLYHIEFEIKNVKKEMKTRNDERGDIDDNLEKHEQNYRRQQSELAALKKEYLMKQKDFVKYKKVINKRLTRLEKITVEQEHLSKEVKSSKTSLKRKNKAFEKRKDLIKQREAELENLEEQIETENEKFDQEKAEIEAEFSRLSEEDLVEYRRLKQEANNKTAKEQQELNNKQDDKERHDQEVSAVRKQLASVKRQRTTKERNLKSEKKREESLKNNIGNIRLEIDTAQKLHAKSVDTKEHKERQKKQIERELGEVKDQLRDVISQADSYQRAMRLNQAIESIKSLFTNCYGKVSDLYEVTRPERYSVGVNVALGIHHNSIVVGNENVAEECIKYLKEQRIRPMTFIPLETIKVKKIQERIRDQIGQDSKLVVDVVIASEPKFQKAINFVFGNTVIARDLTAARRLAFGPRRRDTRDIMRDEDDDDDDPSSSSSSSKRNLYKIVTFKGEIIHKSGLLTGGDFDELSRQARRRQQQRASQQAESDIMDSKALEEKRDKLMSKMHSTVQEIEKARKGSETHSRDVEEKKKKLQFLNNDLKFVKSQIKVKSGEKKNLERDIQKKEKQLKNLQRRLQSLIREIGEQSERIKAKKAEVFEEFGQRCNVEDIGIYDEKKQELKQKRMKEISQLEMEKSQVESTLEYERQKGKRMENDIDNIKRKISLDEDKYRVLEEEKNKALKKVEKVKKSGDKVSKRLTVVQESQRKLELELASLEKMRGQVEAQRVQIRQACLALELRLAQLRNRRIDISRKCELREIHLPFVDESEHLGSTRKRRRIARREEDSEDDDEDSGEEDDEDEDDVDMSGSRRRKPIKFSESFAYKREDKDEETQPSQSQDQQEEEEERKRKRAEVEDDEVKKRLDFRSLDSMILNKQGTEYNRIESELQQEIEELKREMAVLAPSVGHSRKQEEARKKKLDSEDLMMKAREKAKDAQDEFEEIKEKRFKAFMGMFKPVKESIDQIYKNLTKSDTYPLGGTAHIALEDPDEPYLMGIKYNTMPPTKRYRKMEQLSGGEKTLAALALLFAIQYQKPSPFFVLDEIDASLDASNVNKVANYIKNQSEKCQFIVISLKESFYYIADTLIGVYSLPVSKASTILTLDLREYADDDDDDDDDDDVDTTLED